MRIYKHSSSYADMWAEGTPHQRRTNLVAKYENQIQKSTIPQSSGIVPKAH